MCDHPDSRPSRSPQYSLNLDSYLLIIDTVFTNTETYNLHSGEKSIWEVYFRILTRVTQTWIGTDNGSIFIVTRRSSLR